jgi:hypothetical protein
MAYTRLGFLPIVPTADLANDTSEINTRGTGRKGDGSAGKHAGMMVLRDNGSADYDFAIATGSAPTDKWIVFQNTTDVTPS